MAIPNYTLRKIKNLADECREMLEILGPAVHKEAAELYEMEYHSMRAERLGLVYWSVGALDQIENFWLWLKRKKDS